MSMLQSGGPQAAPAAPEGLIKETTTQGFVKDVIEESKRQPVLIDFWAPWCGPCKQLTPVLEKVVRAAKGKVKLVKMNIDEHPAIPGQMGIQSIPAVIAFVNGQPADGFMGAVPESQVTAFIDKLTAGMPGEPNIAEILKDRWIEAATLPRTAAQSGVAVAVIHGALVRVGEHGVGFADFLEFIFRVRIVGIAIRMKLQRQLAIGALQFLLRDRAGHAQHFVVVAFCVRRQNTGLSSGA